MLVHIRKDGRKQVCEQYKAKDAVVAALNVIAPGDSGHLWEALKASNSVEKALQISEECPADKRYLEALAETY